MSVSVWDGEVSAEQRQRHMARLASDPEWGTGGLVLTDLTGVCSSSAPSPERVLETATVFVRRLAGKSRNGKWTVVANHTFEQALQFGAHVQAEVPRMVVFDTRSSASRWLGIELREVGAIVTALRHELWSSDFAWDRRSGAHTARHG